MNVDFFVRNSYSYEQTKSGKKRCERYSHEEAGDSGKKEYGVEEVDDDRDSFDLFLWLS
jgi:hypothetical protein